MQNESGLGARPAAIPPASASDASPTDSPASADGLKRQLNENESQRTEVIGHINQLNIQLHRWQLRLQTLNDRRKELNLQFSRMPKEDRDT